MTSISLVSRASKTSVLAIYDAHTVQRPLNINDVGPATLNINIVRPATRNINIVGGHVGKYIVKLGFAIHDF